MDVMSWSEGRGNRLAGRRQPACKGDQNANASRAGETARINRRELSTTADTRGGPR